MNYKMMGRFASRMLLIEGFFMIPAALICFFQGEIAALHGFLTTIGLILLTFLVLLLTTRNAPSIFGAKEGFVCVGTSWIILGIFGCLPFWFSREIPHFVDAFFEIVSGFTTTGASILSDVEGLSRGLLYWRSFTHWLGGMGVLVFLLAIAPGSKGSGYTIHLLRAERPGPEVGKLVPKMRNTAAITYIIYIVMTVLDILFLLCGGLSLLDACCLAFGTAGTGGFGVLNNSFVSYSPYIQWVTTVFMALFGVNFGLYYLLLLRHTKNIFKDAELRMYLGIFLAAIALITLNITRSAAQYYDTLGETIRHAAFQVSSLMTTTGYSSVDFDLWPGFSRTVLVMLMFVGACAGSTGGGFKCSRLLLVFKILVRNIRQMLHPQRVQVVRLNNRVVDEKVLTNVNAYLAAYIMLLFLSFLAISVDGFSVGTNFTAVLACLNNIGPGLEGVGPMRNFSSFSDFSKLVLCFDMLAGRLEIFPILVLLSRSTWRR